MLITFILNATIICIVVAFHYEALNFLSYLLPKISSRLRPRVIVGVLGALIAHSLEIWMFAIAYYVMINTSNWGSLSGNFSGNIFDCAYFSFTTFTSLGFGDIVPSGRLRYLTGLETLTGLVLITWTASYMFLEMQRFWEAEKASSDSTKSSTR